MPDLSRRHAVKLGLSSLAALSASRADSPPAPHPFLTSDADFEDVSRGTPKPHTLTGDALLRARLTPETWRLHIEIDPTTTDIVTQKPQIETHKR